VRSACARVAPIEPQVARIVNPMIEQALTDFILVSSAPPSLSTNTPCMLPCVTNVDRQIALLFSE
jgi:hypothetical protein